jgi:2-polyprenyl-6-methoxyphenol hydroxylase-like FAD-dependent oxidoreductase
MRRPGGPLVDGNVLLVGDAAGLLDPFTGEGIYAAIWSGRAAAAQLAAYVGGQASDLRSYQREVAQALLPDLSASWQCSELFHVAPAVWTALVRSRPSGWELLCRLLRGEQSFAGLKRRLGPAALGLDLASDLIRTTPWLQRLAGMQEPLPPERFRRRHAPMHGAPAERG